MKKEVKYDTKFIEKIEAAQKNYRNGQFITIKDAKNIWESILLK